MPEKKVSVNDILSEIELDRVKNERPAGSGDRARIDSVIREILTQKQEDALRRENRRPTEQEQRELEAEIDRQTKELTSQFEKLQGSGWAVKAEEKTPGSGLDAEEPVARAAKEPSRSVEEEAGRVKPEMEVISGHFGNFKMEDASVEEGYARTKITLKNYRDLKNSRNKKVDAFILNGKNKPAKEEPVPEEPMMPEEDFPEEYRSPGQAEEVTARLRDACKKLRGSLIALSAAAINAFLLAFVKPDTSVLVWLGGISIRPRVYAILNLSLLVFALIAGHSLFQNISDCGQRRQATKDRFYAVTAVLCAAVNLVYCFQPARLLSPGVCLYTSATVILLCLSAGARYQNACRTMDSFRFLAGGKEKYAVILAENSQAAREMTKGILSEEPVLAKNVRVDFVDHFLTHSGQEDASDRLGQRLLYAALPISVGLAALGWFLSKDYGVALTSLTGGMLICAGLLGTVMVSLPLLDSGEIIRRYGGMMPSGDAVESYSEVNSVLLEGGALFPEGSVLLHGVKTFQGRRVDDVIIDAASVVCAAGSAFQYVFLGIIGGRGDLLLPVDSLQYEDLMGLSAWVNEKRVLIGNRELMINHSIAVPKKEFEEPYLAEGKELVYLATGGDLAAAFVLEFTADPSVENMLRILEKHQVALVIRAVDACITPELLDRLFSVDSALCKVLPSRLHRDFEEETAPRKRADSMLGNDGSLLGCVVSLAAAKKLNHCIRLGALMWIISAVCGVALIALLLLSGSSVLGAPQLILYSGIFALVYWFYEKNMQL